MSRLLTLCLALLIAAPLGAAEDWRAALAQAERALSADPADHAARFAKGVALGKLGQRDAAIAEFEALTRATPDAPEPWNNLAALHAERGDWQAARVALERALATDATYQTAHQNLAAVYAALAGEAYRKALALDAPKPTPTRLALLETLSRVPPAEVAIVAETRTVPTPEVTVTQAEPVVRVTETAPVVEPAQPAATAADAQAEVRAAVEAWAQAWRGKDVAAYLAAYTPDYAPAGQGHATWVAQRSLRVRAPKRIELKLINLTVEMDTRDRAHARFVQDYRSDTFTGATRKTLELVRQDGRWLISAERTGAR
jgi:tetratricopeptide (TPR) repeat protein